MANLCKGNYYKFYPLDILNCVHGSLKILAVRHCATLWVSLQSKRMATKYSRSWLKRHASKSLNWRKFYFALLLCIRFIASCLRWTRKLKIRMFNTECPLQFSQCIYFQILQKKILSFGRLEEINAKYLLD